MSEHKEEELVLNFEEGKILRNDKELMTLDELLFLLGGAVQYNGFAPIPQSEEFIAELREVIGLGFTKEQFEEIKKFNQQWNE